MSKPSKLIESPLSETQWATARTLADELSNEQLHWLSGFFAGVSHGRAGQSPAASPSSPQAPAGTARRMIVLYGSETGNSAGIARKLVAQFGERGQTATLLDMADCKPRQLGEAQDLLVIASTYGEGDPPQPATSFFEFIEGRKAPRLEGVRYAVLALGDTSYEHFCAAGRRLDERFQALGAERLLARVDCDVDFEEAANEWQAKVLQEFAATSAVPAAVSSGGASPGLAPATSVHDKQNPFSAPVLENLVLTGRGSSKEVRHIELSLEGSGLRYEPGDALGVVPQNDPALVHAALELTGLSADTPVTLKGQGTTLIDALTRGLDLVSVTPRFLEQWAQLADVEELRRLSLPESAAERVSFARGNHVTDVMRRYPVPGVDAALLLAALRPLQPRLYSIASSAAAVPDEVHLTVSSVRYELHGLIRTGVSSGHLATLTGEDAQVPVYVQPSLHFHLPADDVPIIMIGAGTGVAPYRAFLQEREVRGAPGSSWLFFGERQFRTDFLYQTEWQTWLRDGLLTRMDVAFSRDPGRERVYVQHRLLERSQDVYAWLEEGAHVYVCGDAERMAPDVHRTLGEIVMQQGGRGEEAAQEYLRQLQENGRYQRDVY